MPAAETSPPGQSGTPGGHASIALPTGGGAIRGIGERFAANPITGTAALTVPLALTPDRGGSPPQIALTYDSGTGNGPFGLGWQASLPSIVRKTDKGLPRYRDDLDSDVFTLAAAEDLVPMLDDGGDPVVDATSVPAYAIARYRPRIEGAFTRVERWTRKADGDAHWRTISPNNVLAVYGRDGESRVSDPSHPRRTYAWLLCETRDDRGNAMLVQYKAEDGVGVDVDRAHERSRGGAESPARGANRYVKRILYGNQRPLLDANGRRPVDLTAQQLAQVHWLFEAVFDYGEHDEDDPKPDDAGAWDCRSDPFSTRRAGFEVRTYRLCRRVLMFHHFPEEDAVGDSCLVRSTALAYQEDPAGTLLASVRQSGHTPADGGGYDSRSLPPLTFEYSSAEIAAHAVEPAPGSLENLPSGPSRPTHRWIDLDGEGLPGVLADEGGGWWYKRNLGGGRLGPSERVDPLPASSYLRAGGRELVDLDGDGRLDLLELDAPGAGFAARRGPGAGWDDFHTFASVPRVDWASPHLRLIDLTGDGLADVLVTDEHVYTWYPSLATEGFAEPERAAPPFADEDGGPRLVLADRGESLFLADMTGDGLTDLVRVRRGEVAYWPNLGHGRFGAKVEMDEAPAPATADAYDAARVRLADIDGSGVADLAYVGAHAVHVWSNQSGNGWGPPRVLPDLPHLDDHVAVNVADLLGNGTACLVWTSPLPADEGRALRYLDLTGGVKPNLLVRTTNGFGAETRVTFAPSTKYYLADRDAGRPWMTRLPFPVQVIERVEQLDHVGGTRFVSTYTYHHGYYDGADREFRGFAMVEQTDDEAFEDHVVGVPHADGGQTFERELFQPPVTTRTWFHTGAHLEGERILHQLRQEYHLGVQRTPEPLLPEGLDEHELRECSRALKGMVLREELYCFDGTPPAPHPYSVVEYGYEVRLVQRRGTQRHAVLLPLSTETLTHQFDRRPSDARVEHALVLESGPYGEVRRSATVNYGRVAADPEVPAAVTAAQQQRHVLYEEAEFTDDFDELTPVPAYRLRTSYDRRGFDVTGVAPAGTTFALDELRDAIAGTTEEAYEVVVAPGDARRRLLSHTRILFCSDGLAPLPLGDWDRRGIAHESYRLTFTPGLLAAAYGGAVGDAELADAGYVHFDGDANWWAPSGTATYPADPAAHFFRPHGLRNPFGAQTRTTWDDYELLPVASEVVDAAWTRVEATNDYRLLHPVEVLDENQNRTAVTVDPLGLVTAMAVMGKDGVNDGDTLDAPTSEIEYALDNWIDSGKPIHVRVRARERHRDPTSPWNESYAYADGSGGVMEMKVRARPGKALAVAADGSAVEVPHADPRWVGDGRTILNNKGLPVKKYEPYFSTTHEFEDEEALRTLGVTPILFYDPIGRIVRTDTPDGRHSRVEYGPWRQRSYDENDTVLDSRWYADRGSPAPAAEPEPVGDPERRAAWLAAHHADTPTTVHFDSLGRGTCDVVDHGGGTTAFIRSEADVTGRFMTLFDQQGREVATGFEGITGTSLRGATAERGERWMFHDVLGNELRTWDEHGRSARTEFDDLRRAVSAYVTEPGQPERLFTHTVYGDRHPDAVARNLRGVEHQVFDQSGMSRVLRQDFAGNPTEVERVLARDYKNVLDWGAVAAQGDYDAVQAAAAPRLQATDTFAVATGYDALGRVTAATLPGGTKLECDYDEGGGLSALRTQIGGQGAFVDVLIEHEHDAQGRPLSMRLGNDVVTSYTYDPVSTRLTRRLSVGAGAPESQALQDVRLTYDPVGNVTELRDRAQQTHFFANAAVPAGARYRYDAVYQLVEATGREHAVAANDAVRDASELGAVQQMPHLNDATAVRNYTETYEYDVLGNIRRLRHTATVGGGSWTRHYRYAYDDDAADVTNRLVRSSRPGDPDAGPYTQTYDHDAYGHMTRLRLPTSDELVWDFAEQLREADLGGGGRAYYVYDSLGHRIRKVIERLGGTIREQIDLGWVEITRQRQSAGATPHYERQTVHVSVAGGRVAQVDVKTRDDTNQDPANPLGTPLWRYQYGDPLGSTTVETDAAGAVISYEEYHPFGTTAYRSSKPGVDHSLKRYRFAGKERDDETGLYHGGARPYAPWLGRWVSPDPAGFADGFCLFRYCGNNPVNLADPDGTQATAAPATETYLPGTPELRLTPQSTLEERAAFAERHGHRMIDPHPEQQRWVGTPEAGDWELSPEGRLEAIPRETITFEDEVLEVEPPPVEPPPEPPPEQPAPIPPPPEQPPAPPAAGDGGRSGWSYVVGGLQILGGVVEGVAAVALLLTPEPTMVTKVGGVVLGAHAIDSIVAGARTLWNGEVAHTATHAVGAGAARAMGASESTANMAGTGLDIAASLGPAIAVGLSRRAAVAAAERGAASAAAERGVASFGEQMTTAAGRGGVFPSARPVIAQQTGHTCVTASCRMILQGAGRTAAPAEAVVHRMLGGVAGEGAFVGRAAGLLRSMGVRGGRYINTTRAQALARVEEATSAGRSAMVSVKLGPGSHALVVDRVKNGWVYFRDPLPVGIGSSWRVPVGDFLSQMTGRAVIW